MKTDKPEFFVFCDIDGVLDLNLSKTEYTHDSVKALNYLLKKLEEKYDARLVITSDMRRDMLYVEELLEFSNLEHKKKVLATPFEPFTSASRSNDILSFLVDKRIYRGFEVPENLVVIDDNDYDFTEIFPPQAIIKTKYSLTMNQVKDYVQNVLHLDVSDDDDLLPPG